ncbi:MAG: HAMP domain-containing histidine kinase [Syntrophorhabdaceae bacterium]|nr:HAMP domain-containing histidine kinase [Syntrophorhabdaceae bacterium]
MGRKRYYMILIVGSTLLITGLHHIVPQERVHPTILEELYYMPILAGAVIFGMKGALLTFGLASLSYLPFFFGAWVGPSPFEFLDRLFHLIFSGVFAVFTGFLIERDWRRREELGKERYLAGVGRAAAEIVHDLKSPLMAISGFAARIKEGRGEAARAAQMIIDAAQTMEKTTAGILGFAKPADLDPKEEDVADLLNRVLDTSLERARKSGIKLSVDMPPERLKVSMDSLQIQRALTNLVDNAIDASEEGQVVKVRTTVERNYLSIRVVDHGSGMDKETLGNLFTPFYSKKSQGTGLGLATAKKIVDQHRGAIFVKSKPGAGTEVTIRLPVGKAGHEREKGG